MYPKVLSGLKVSLCHFLNCGVKGQTNKQTAFAFIKIEIEIPSKIMAEGSNVLFISIILIIMSRISRRNGAIDRRDFLI